MMDTSLDSFLEHLAPSTKEGVLALSVPTLINDDIAFRILAGVVSHDAASEVLREVKALPLWCTKNFNFWCMHEDLREPALAKLNGSGEKLRRSSLGTIMALLAEDMFPNHSINSVVLQVARLSLTVEETLPAGAMFFRKIFDVAAQYEDHEGIRIPALYASEISVPSSGSLSSRYLDLLFIQAMYYYKSGERKFALPLFRDIWKRHAPSDASKSDVAIAAHLYGVIISESAKHYSDEAESAFRSSLELGEDNIIHCVHVLHSLGVLISRDSMRSAEAEKILYDALRIASDNVSKSQVLNSIGMLLTMMPRKRWGDAEVAFKNSVKIDPSNVSKAQTLNSLGRLLSKIGGKRLSEAEDTFNRSLQSNPNEMTKGQVLNNLGMLFARMGRKRWAEAEESFSKSIACCRVNRRHQALANYQFARFLSKCGRVEEALKHASVSLRYQDHVDWKRRLEDFIEDLEQRIKSS